MRAELLIDIPVKEDKETDVTILNVIDPADAKNDVLHSGLADSTVHKQKEKLSKIIEVYERNDIPYNLHYE